MSPGVYINESICEVEMINNIDRNILNCYLRPILIAANSQAKYSLYSILLSLQKVFHADINAWFRVENDLIDISYNAENADFYGRISQLLLEKKNLIFCFNHYYHKEYYTDYKQRHHFHYTLIKGYDSIKNEVIVIDEDPRHEIEFPDKTPIYKERTVDADIFKDACINTRRYIDEHPLCHEYMVMFKDANIDIAMPVCNNFPQFTYITVKKADGTGNPSDIGLILSKYRTFLYESLTVNKIELELLGLYLLQMKTKDLAAISGLHELPREIRKFSLYEGSYTVQEYIFERLMHKDSQYKIVRSLFKSLNKHARMMRILINKYILSHNVSLIDVITQKYLPELFEKEKHFVFEMINFINKYEQNIKASMIELITYNSKT